MPFTAPLHTLTKADAAIAGGKGASLGELARAGFPTPPGFVVLSSAFDRFHGAEEIPAELAEEIGLELRKLHARWVAVRSSATCEDSATSAWAGQLDTYLNTAPTQVARNVQRCWASLGTARAVSYAAERGFDRDTVSVAVVVQKMLRPLVAGTAFSVHPVTENPDHMIIEAVYGLGEACVGGEVTPDAYVVDKPSLRIHQKSVTEQRKELDRHGWRDVPPQVLGRQKLGDAQIVRLARLVRDVERHYGFPCDVEWAFDRRGFHLLQSRPITTLKR